MPTAACLSVVPCKMKNVPSRVTAQAWLSRLNALYTPKCERHGVNVADIASTDFNQCLEYVSVHNTKQGAWSQSPHGTLGGTPLSNWNIVGITAGRLGKVCWRVLP